MSNKDYTDRPAPLMHMHAPNARTYSRLDRQLLAAATQLQQLSTMLAVASGGTGQPGGFLHGSGLAAGLLR
jgi:ribulose-5-phosphate 4-epimerase/fuculose-1-phosphate aldolase